MPIAYDLMRQFLRAIEERRADREYWREVRKRRQDPCCANRPIAGHRSVSECIAAQLDHDVFLASPRTCPECRHSFVLINVNGVELDTCLECGSFWFDAGEFGSLTAHEEFISQSSMVGPSKLRCPVCGGSMDQRALASSPRLLIDACPSGHGVYINGSILRSCLSDSTKLEPG